jgi:solute carrier family 35
MAAKPAKDEDSLPLLSADPSKDEDGKPLKAHAPTPAEVRAAVVVSVAVCSFYVIVSASMVFVNKALTYSFGFRSTNSLLLLQMLFTIALLRALRALRVVDFVDFERSKAAQVAPVSLFYSLNAAVALVALRELSVPSYTLIKRLAPLFTLALEFLLLGKRTTGGIAASLFVMTSGTVLAAKSDATSTLPAWMLGVVSCLFQAMYLTYVKRSGADTGMSSVGILYYHSILSLPFIALIILGVGEISAVIAYPHWTSPAFLLILVLSLTMGLLLNYALFLCTELTSPTSTVVSGQVKAMAQTAIGMFTFGGVDMNSRYLLGTLLNISGGFGYAACKYSTLKSSL